MGYNLSKLAPSDEGLQYSLDLGEEDKSCDLVDSQSTDKLCRLEVRGWTTTSRSYKLRIESLGNQAEFAEELDWVTGVLHLVFVLPAGYQGGPAALLQRVEQLFAGGSQLGILSCAVSPAAMEDMQKALPHRAEVHGKSARGATVSGCSCSWTRSEKEAGKVLCKYTIKGKDAACFLIDANDDGYRQLMGDGDPSQFSRMMAVPVRIWLCIREWSDLVNGARKGSEALFDAVVDAAREAAKEPAVNVPAMLRVEEKQEWWQSIHYRVIAQSGEGAAREHTTGLEACALDNSSEYATEGEAQPEWQDATIRHVNDTQQTDQHVDVHILNAKNDEEGTGLDDKDASAQSSQQVKIGRPLTNQEIRRVNFKKKYRQKLRVRRKMAQEEDGPVVVTENDGADDVAHDGIVADDNTATINTALRPESSASSSSFHTAQDLQQPSSPSPPSPPATPSPPPTPSLPPAPPTVWAKTPKEGHEKNMERTGDTGKSTPRTRPSMDKHPEQQPCQSDTERGMSKETATVALSESESHQPQYIAVDGPTTSPQEISPRSDRGSPGPTSELDTSSASTLSSSSLNFDRTEPVENASSSSEGSQATAKVPDQSSGKAKKKNKSKPGRKKKGLKRMSRTEKKDQLSESATGFDNSQQAQSPDEESRQHDPEAQEPAVTDASSSAQSQYSAHAAPMSSVPASAAKSAAKSDKRNQRDSGITVPAAAFPSTDVNHPSDASAKDQLEDADPETLTNPPYKGEPSPSGSAEAQAAPSASVPASQARRNDPSNGTTLTRTPSHESVVVVVGRTRGEAQMCAACSGPGPQTAALTESGAAGASPPSQQHGFAAPAATSSSPGAQTSRQHAATSAVGVVTAGLVEERHSSGAPPSTTLGPDANTAPMPITTPASQGNFQRVEKPTHGGFFWDLTNHSFKCAMQGCEKRCAQWDGSTVICPRCGPYSKIRYCGKDHQREDVKWHWTYCGQEEYTFKHWCVPSSLPRDVEMGPPMLPSVHGWDSPERQRQALWFSTGRQEGDYFLFTDWSDQVKKGAIPGSFEDRCSPRVLRVVEFNDPEEKDRFRRVLAVCLFASLEHQTLVDYLYRMIRDNLRAQDQWNAQTDVMLRHQFKYEMGLQLRPSITGDRHACKTEWTGHSRRHCQDRTCVSEIPPALLGQQARLGQGFDRLCTAMESEFWILRANRTTHPVCQDVRARMRGEGYGDDVAPQDRRAFRRGEGWDGAGTGPMEIEGPDWRDLASHQR